MEQQSANMVLTEKVSDSQQTEFKKEMSSKPMNFNKPANSNANHLLGFVKEVEVAVKR